MTKRIFLANNFESFIRGLMNTGVYEMLREDLKETLLILESGSFSTMLQDFFKKENALKFDKALRNLLLELSNSKDYFALLADPLSYLVYDVQFYLFSKNQKVESKTAYLKEYPKMIALSNNEISTKEYSEGFVEDWFEERISQKHITVSVFGGLSFTEQYAEQMMSQLKKYE